MGTSKVFSVAELSSTVYRIVEDDCFRENPFIYLVKGDDKLVLIDTGCGTDDILEFIRREFARNRQISSLLDRILVINTHNHYDHVGCNFIFSPKNGPRNERCLDLCASSANKSYTRDKFNTLECFVGARVKPYAITRWLDDGEEISLSADDPSNILKVFHAPGHSPDSVCLFYPKDERLFVGDVIYRWASIMAIGAGACPSAFRSSLEKLCEFVETRESRSKSPIRLSCGHVDDDLESVYLKQLRDLVTNVDEGRAGCAWCSCWFASYSTEDRSLTFQLRRWRFLDPILVRFFKLFYYLCCCYC